MSTYTDLHNRIRENLTILRKPGSTDDGMSPQKVILVNPENQFYGTFSGQMNITGGTLSDLALVGGTLNGTTLKDAKFLNGNQVVPIGELAASVSEHEQRISVLEVAKDIISDAHDFLSVGLSSAIDTLSLSIDTKLDEAVKDIKDGIEGVVSGVGTLSDDLSSLSGKVEALSTSMLNGVVYKGTLLLKQNEYESPFELFKPSTQDKCCMVRQSEAEEVYSNGWMYRIALDHSTENIPSDTLYVKLHDLTGSDFWMLGEGDFIIIKNHDNSKYSIKVGEITLADLDRINAQDQDDVHEALLKEVSSWLDRKADFLSSKLCGEIQSLSTSLSDEISSLSAKLCSEIESDRKTIKEVSVEVLLSAESYTNSKIENLSATTSALVGVVSSETLVSANAFTKTYADNISTEISLSVDNRLEVLSNALTSYSDELCSRISSRVDAEYVHKVGDTIAKLSVEGHLDVSDGVSISGNVAIDSKDGSTLQFGGTNGVTLETNDKVTVSSAGSLNITASRLKGTFRNGLELSSDRGLDSLSVNGKTIQSTLDDLTSNVSGAVDARLSALSNDLTSYSNKLSHDISSQVNIEYVHKAGDKIAWADIEKLSAGKIEVGKLSAKSIENIELKTSESIILSSASGIEANVGLDKVVLAGTSLQKTIQDVSSYLDHKKLDVDLANKLSNQICSDVINSGYLKAISVNLEYDRHAKLITLIAGTSSYSISTDDFVKDGMLENARYDAIGDDDHQNPPYIVLTFNTDADKNDIWLPVKELVDVYGATNDGIALDADHKTFMLKYGDIKDRTGLNALSDDLYGKPGEIGRLQDLQNQISTISADDFGTLAFTGHLVPIIGTPYESLSALFSGTDNPLYPGCVKNGGTYNIAFKKDPDPLVNVNEKSVSVDLGAGKTLLLGNGDILIVHDHSNRRFVPLSDLTYAENGIGNIYLIKTGVSRYEFEDEAKKRADETNFISSWIISNFVNVEDDSYDSTTTFKQDLSATKDLSVAGSTLLLGELKALDGAFNVLSSASGKVISGEAKEIVLSASDVIKLSGDISANNGLSVVGSFHTLSNHFRVDFTPGVPGGPVDKYWIGGEADWINFNTPEAKFDIDGSKMTISASSYLGLSANDVKILSVMSVDSEKAAATKLSVGILSADILTSRTLDVTKKLSATNAYADQLSVGQEVVKTLSVEDNLSIGSFSNLYAKDTLCSVASLCVGLSTQISGLCIGLSTQISGLSTQLSTQISGLSIDLSTQISTLSINLSTQLSTICVDLSTEISGLSTNLCGVIDDIRSDLSTKLDCETALPIVIGTLKSTDGFKTSGDIEVLSGNYIQTDDDRGYVQNYSDRNSFLQAECSQKYYDIYGIACTGTRGYCILSSNASTKTIVLSGDLSQLKTFFASNPTAKWSTSFGSGSYSQELTISEVVQDTPEYGHIKTTTATKIGNQTQAECIKNWNEDDNAFYCPKHPEIGNTTIPAFYANHAEGAATKAIQRCTHAEGRNTISEIRYSHAEGSDTYAAEMFSHAEGNTTKALGRAAHSEGGSTTAEGANSHAEGESTYAKGLASHASGVKAYANDEYSFAWSGLSSTTYSSHGAGTFNVNPKGEISGFYVGDKTLASHFSNLNSAASQMSAYGLTQAKSYANGISSALSTQIGNLDVENTLAAGQILTSLSQSDGKISYGAKTLEMSDVNGLTTNTTNTNLSIANLCSEINTLAKRSREDIEQLKDDLWSSLSTIAKTYDAPSAMPFADAVSAIFAIAKTLSKYY